MTESLFAGITGIKFHVGVPQNEGMMSFLTKEYGFNGKWCRWFTEHRIAKLYGISFKLRFFLGFALFSDTTDRKAETPLPAEQ